MTIKWSIVLQKTTAMKLTHLLFIGFALLTFAACQPEETPNCRPNTYGIYTGSNGLGGTIEADVAEGSGEKGLIIVISNKDASGATNSAGTTTGELNESCTTLTIPEQMIGTQTYSGSLVVTDTKLTGTITISSIPIPVDLTKQ